MAIGWWFDTGINSKMESDVWRGPRGKNRTTEWKRPTTNPKESLEPSHVLLILIIYGAATMFSTVVFGLELLSQRYKRMKQKEIETKFYKKIERRVEDTRTTEKTIHRINAAHGMPQIEIA